MLEKYVLPLAFSPHIQTHYRLPNGNLLLYGHLDPRYYTSSLWEIDDHARTVREWQFSDYTSCVIPARNGDLFLFGSKHGGRTGRGCSRIPGSARSRDALSGPGPCPCFKTNTSAAASPHPGTGFLFALATARALRPDHRYVRSTF
ncbi:MAG: hypothetical protein U5N26_02940 [Candidatus Marinimicrobia bacterium]|nr:hypothetical protein [Candidatus Neomarinimicrobiota bacterium]